MRGEKDGMGRQDSEIRARDPTAFQVDVRRLPTKKQLPKMLAAPFVINQFVPRSLPESFQTVTEIESQRSLEDKANCPVTSRVWARVWMAVRSTRLNDPSIRAAHVLLSRKLGLEAGGTGVLFTLLSILRRANSRRVSEGAPGPKW